MASDTPDEGAPTETLVAGAVGDRCVSCGTTLQSDQRYCVVCGERRGAPRFTLPPVAPAGPDRDRAPRSRRPRAPRVSSGATLVAGVGTLLLAMGVGVLIGRGVGSDDSRTVASAAPQVITVNGGGGSASATTPSASAASPAKHRPATTHDSHGAKKKKVVVIDKKQAAAASQAASKVLGASAANTPPATVTVGQKGHGAGFNKKTGKFDGSFFGQ